MWRMNCSRKMSIALTAVVIACIASNPEFASFVPMLDVVGVDVLVYMVASQLGIVVLGSLMPCCRQACIRWGIQLLRALRYAFSFCIGGYLRQLGWYVRHVGFIAAAGWQTRLKLS